MIPAIHQSQHSNDGFVAYPPPPPPPLASNTQPIAYFRYGPCPDLVPMNVNPSHFNGYENAFFYQPNDVPAMTRNVVPSNMVAMTSNSQPVYSVLPNSNIPSTSNTFGQDSHLMNSSTCTGGQISSLPPINPYCNNSALIPYMIYPNGQCTMPQSTLLMHADRNKTATVESNLVNTESTSEHNHFYSRLWTGDLQYTAQSFTDYLCRFQIEPDMFNEVKSDLIQLFRANIHINDTFPPENSPSPYSLYAYFKASCFGDFLRHCKNEQMHIWEFVHPEKNYKLEVRIKQFNLPYDLRYRVKYQHGSIAGQLYVEGLDGLFSAKDLFKIYNDLYSNVLLVRVFTDKNGYAHKSAVINFKSANSHSKALKESPIMVKTSSFTALLRNKMYDRKDNSHGNSNLRATTNCYEQSHRNRYYLQNHNNQSDTNDSGTSNKHLKTKVFESKQSFVDRYCKDRQRLCKTRHDAVNDISGRYAKMKHEYSLYNKLKFQNYLSD